MEYILDVLLLRCDSITTTSNTALLTVGTIGADITSQPENSLECTGSSAQFGILASGSNLSYQWQVNGTNLSNTSIYSGVTADTLNISNVTGLNNRQYRCIVSGICFTTRYIQYSESGGLYASCNYQSAGGSDEVFGNFCFIFCFSIRGCVIIPVAVNNNGERSTINQ